MTDFLLWIKHNVIYFEACVKDASNPTRNGFQLFFVHTSKVSGTKLF